MHSCRNSQNSLESTETWVPKIRNYVPFVQERLEKAGQTVKECKKNFPFCRNIKSKNKAKLGLVKRIAVGTVMVVVLLPPLCPATMTLTIAPTRQGGHQRRRRRRGVVGGGTMTTSVMTMMRIWMGGEGRGGRRMKEQPLSYATWATSAPTSQQL